MKTPTTILALDVGSKRIGIAASNDVARIASPLLTLNVGDNVMKDIAELIDKHQATELVIGLPRGLEGQETAQTKYVRNFADKLKQCIDIPMHFQDEALSSVMAEEQLLVKGNYTKADIDKLAATQILDDFLNNKRALGVKWKSILNGDGPLLVVYL